MQWQGELKKQKEGPTHYWSWTWDVCLSTCSHDLPWVSAVQYLWALFVGSVPIYIYPRKTQFQMYRQEVESWLHSGQGEFCNYIFQGRNLTSELYRFQFNISPGPQSTIAEGVLSWYWMKLSILLGNFLLYNVAPVLWTLCRSASHSWRGCPEQ